MYSLRSKLPKANTQNIEPRWSRESLHHIWVKIWPHKHIWKLQNLKSRDKSISKELSCTYHWDILVSCTTQCHNNTLLNFRSIYLFWGHLREVNLHLKMVAVAYEEVVDYKEVPNIVIWLENFRYFAKLVAYKRWSQLEVRLYFPFDGEYANRPVLTNPEKIANGVFTLKMHLKSFPSTSLRPRNHGKHNNQRSFWVYFPLRKTRAAKSPDYRNAKVSKMCFDHVEMQGRRFQVPPGLKSVFKKLRFRDGSVWTVGLTVELKLRFQIPPSVDATLLQ